MFYEVLELTYDIKSHAFLVNWKKSAWQYLEDVLSSISEIFKSKQSHI